MKRTLILCLIALLFYGVVFAESLEPLLNKTYKRVTETATSEAITTHTTHRVVLAGANVDRIYFRVQNVSKDVVYITLAASTDAWAATASGIELAASGDVTLNPGTWEMPQGTIYTGEISALHGGASLHHGSVRVLEY